MNSTTSVYKIVVKAQFSSTVGIIETKIYLIFFLCFCRQNGCWEKSYVDTAWMHGLTGSPVAGSGRPRVPSRLRENSIQRYNTYATLITQLHRKREIKETTSTVFLNIFFPHFCRWEFFSKHWDNICNYTSVTARCQQYRRQMAYQFP